MQPVKEPSIAQVTHEKTPSEARLTVLSDGVFAIAMTLLVLNITIPSVPAHVDPEVWFRNHFSNFFGEVITYIITFTVLASYWISHRNLMQQIRQIDGPFTWLTFLFLAFIAFFPAASNLNATQGNIPEVVIVYTIVLAGCGFTLSFLWLYASANAKLLMNEALSQKQARVALLLQLIAPLYFCLSLLLLFIVPRPTDVFYSWIALAFIGFIIRRFEKRPLSSTLQNDG